MSLMLKCSRCSRDMHSSGFKGLCPECLFACTTGPIKPATKAHEPKENEKIEANAQIGAGGRFLLLEKIGEGGMGEVWLANDQQLSSPDKPRLVALKFLSESIRENQQALKSLKMEVRQAQELNDPNIVRIHDLHTSEGGMPFINMEYIEGDNLSTVLQRCEGGVMSSKLVLQIARQLASALYYAHDSAGILHRDIKPSNLLLAEGDILKLTDFGIAGILHGQKDEHALQTQVLGTLWYSSPRQALGKTPTSADDIYSFGATLYELVTGSPPFEGETTEELLAKIQYVPPEHISSRLKSTGRRNDPHPKLISLIHSCLDKEPRNRPIARDLANLLPPPEGSSARSRAIIYYPEPDAPEPVDKDETELPQATQSRWPATILILLLLSVAGVVWVRWPQTPKVVVPKEPATDKAFEPKVPRIITDSETNPPGSTATILAANLSAEVLIKDHDSTPQLYSYQLFDRSEIKTNFSSKSKKVRVQQKAGTYQLRVSRKEGRGEWAQSSELILEDAKLSALEFAFYHSQVVIESKPEGANVYWSDVNENSASSFESNTYTNNFLTVQDKGRWLRSGHYHFHVTMRGYLPSVMDLILKTPGKISLPFINLVINPCPAKGDLAPHTFTNSFQTVFIDVGASSAPPPGTPLYACATETSVGEFQKFVEDTKSSPMDGMYSATTNGYLQVGNSWDHPGWAQTTNHPVVGVNWNDAMSYCEWLAKIERGKGRLAPKQKYRLPSTTEWKKIAELAGARKYPWGDSEAISDIVGNYSGEEVATAKSWPASWPYLQKRNDGYQRTAPPEPKFTNSFGFYHMGGNAAEWCLDQVLCGGSWFDGEDGAYGHNIQQLATDNKLKPGSPSRRDDRYGFRILIIEEE